MRALIDCTATISGNVRTIVHSSEKPARAPAWL
jgi:hypothetical protein